MSENEGYHQPVLRGMRLCPECGSDQLVMDYEVAEMVCKACGLVVSEEITDKGPEWRAFDKEQVEKSLAWINPLRGKKGWQKHILDIEELLKNE